MMNGKISVDNGRGIFVYNESRIVKQHVDERNQLWYSKKMFGDIASIDASNPQKVLVFYKAQSTCVFLDNYLKELQTPINLSDLGLYDVELTCSGSDNSFWCFDNACKCLVKIDSRMREIARSPDVSKLAETPENPILLMQRDDRIFLAYPSFGILVFGNSGEYMRTVHLPPHSYFQPISDNLLFFIDSLATPTTYSLLTATMKKRTEKVDMSSSYFYQSEILYELREGKVIMH